MTYRQSLEKVLDDQHCGSANDLIDPFLNDAVRNAYPKLEQEEVALAVRILRSYSGLDLRELAIRHFGATGLFSRQQYEHYKSKFDKLVRKLEEVLPSRENTAPIAE